LSRPEDASALARRIIKAMRAPFLLDGHILEISTSIGIALAPADGRTGGDLLKNAAIALDRAKTDQRGTFRFFEPSMDERMQARRVLELDLRRALAENQLQLFYQPLVDLNLGRLSGFEALMRWRHPERGMVSPGEFIPVAEDLGLIIDMGEWAVRTACAEACRWPSHVKVAVNVSPLQFKSPRLVEMVAEALAASGLSPQRLELEITESVLLSDSRATLTTLHALHALGVRIAMDDFGTGYSSLGYLRSFPFDKIKIDQSFVRELAEKEDCRAIVRAVVGLGRDLRIRITAEGVETVEQLAQLRDEGVDELQGYLFSKPQPASELPGILQRLQNGADDFGAPRKAVEDLVAQAA
jgi:predicted signal transduction protein with EAL and GGDEF domain